MTTTVEHKSYEVVLPEDLPDDPAHYAEAHGLINNHTLWSRKKVGAWRWAGLQRHREQILPLLIDKQAIDFGGHAGPVGYGAVVVDFDHPERRALYDVEGQVDTIFSCHTLEHIRDLATWMAAAWSKLRPGGHLVVMVPSSWHEKLRAENWPHHAQTFCLSDEPREPQWVCLDELLQVGFELLYLSRTEDTGLFGIAQKRHDH